MNYSWFEQALIDAIPMLQRTAKKLVRCNYKAEELLQNTLCKALSKKHLYRSNDNFKGWVSTVMRNLFINDYHAQHKYEAITFDEAIMSDDCIVANDNTFHKIELRYTQNVVSKLPEAMKCSLLLYANGFQYDEIAKMLDEPIGTVKSRIFLARKRISQLKGDVL